MLALSLTFQGGRCAGSNDTWDLDARGYLLELMTVNKTRSGPRPLYNATRIPRFASELALGLEGNWGEVSYRLRATATDGWDPDAAGRTDVVLQELSREWIAGKNLRLLVGKSVLSWDVGFSAQPLGFFQTEQDFRDITDRFGRSEGLPLIALTWLGESGSVAVVYSNDFENAPDGFNEGLRQWGLNVVYDLPGLTVSGVVQQPEDQRLGLGGSISGVAGSRYAFHGSVFVRRGTRRPTHRSIETQELVFWNSDPYGSFRRHDDRYFARWVIGGRVTPDPWSEFLVEWVHDDRGFDRAEWRRFLKLVDFHRWGGTADVPQESVAANLLHDGQALIRNGARQDYLYVRYSRQIERSSVAISAFVGVADGSFIPAVSADLAKVGRLVLGARASAFVGSGSSEFGMIALDWIIDASVRYDF